MRLYDYGLGTLSQYDLTAERSARTRGALLCYTEQGLLILREFHGSEKKLKKQQELLLHLQANGISTDYFLENTQGSLVSQDKDGQSFTLQRWYEGQECDTRSREDIMKSVRVLAKLHIIMRIQPQDEYKEYRQRSLKEEYTRHNQELRKIRKFIRKKGPTCTFEKKLLAAMEGFLEKGEQAVCLLEQSGYEELREQAWQEGTVCHGEYNQHNVLISREDIAVTNFGRWSYDIQMADLYQFMRKILEKYNWDQATWGKNAPGISRNTPHFPDRVAEPSGTFHLSGEVLETGKLLLFTQESVDLGKEHGKTGKPCPPAGCMGKIWTELFPEIYLPGGQMSCLLRIVYQ